ncbi:MAG: hypothetical protein AB8F95_03705 [Bacteroidia bacterium]
MRSFFFILAFFIGTFCAQQAVAQMINLSQFELKSESANIRISWGIDEETDITEYRLYRQDAENAPLQLIHSQNPGGLTSYEYVDNDIFKNERRVIFYELHVVKNGEIHKFYASLSHNPTAIQRTWGSIKKMFQ